MTVGAAPISKKKEVPGCTYFEKISSFMQDHVEVGELYLEYVKCEFCKQNPASISNVERVPRPMPDKEALPDLQYLPCN